MNAPLRPRLEVDPAVLARCDGELVARRATDQLAGLLTGLNVPTPVRVAVVPGTAGELMSLGGAGGEVIGRYPAAGLASLSVLDVAPDLTALSGPELADLLAALAGRLAADDLPGLLGADGLRGRGAPVAVVRRLLDLWIRVPADGLADLDEDAAPEAVVAALRPAELRLRVAPSYLRALTGLPHRDAFPVVLARLAARLGVPPPVPRLRAGAELAPGIIQPVVNDVALPAVLGLPADRIVVGESAAVLRAAGFAADPMDPGDPEVPRSLVPAGQRERLAGRYEHWNAVEVLAFWWETFVPTVAWRVFDQGDLGQLADRVRPALPVLARVVDALPAAPLTERLRRVYRVTGSLWPLPVTLEREAEELLLLPPPTTP